MPPVPPLREPTIPIEGESARGLVCRALGNNGVPLSFNVLRRLGMRHRNVVTISESDELDVEGLAKVIRVGLADIETRRYPPLDRGRLSFFGLEVPSSAIEKKTRRFSPAELGKSPHIRAEWELKNLPFCSSSWELLTDRCVCGIRQGWIRLNGVHRCDDCGRLLKGTPAPCVPEELRQALSLVAGLASPLEAQRKRSVGALPAALRDVERSRLFNGIVRLSRSSTDKAADVASELGALHEACRVTLSWRSDAASWLRRAAPLPRDRSRAATSSGAAPKPKATRRPSPPAEKKPPREAAPRERSAPKLLGIRPAYELAKLSPETLLAARSRGYLGPHEGMRAGRMVPAFDRDEVILFADLFRAQLSADAVAYRLGIGKRAVEEIARAGHLCPRGLALRENEAFFLPADVEDFEERLEAAVRPSLSDAIPLKTAMRAIHGRPKPWAAVVAALLAGDLPYELDFRALKTLGELRIERSSASLLTKLPSSTWTRDDRVAHGEALEILNAHNSSRALDGLRSQGTNPRSYLLTEVLALARRGISTLEASSILVQSPAEAYHVIRRAGIDVVTHSLWDRAQIEELSVMLQNPGRRR